MNENDGQVIEQKLDKIILLLQHLVAVQMYRTGASRVVIRRNLHVAKSTIVDMLRDVEEVADNERQATN